jgi:hypothetical protein
MKIIPISKLIPNPSNPRLIKDDKFHKLVQSLKDFPEMAKVRPIVVNTEMVILGGNMRFKAMKEAGWKEVPVEVVDWSEEKQKEFIIKDNVGFGEWEWDMLANEWEADDLEKWGLDVPNWSAGSDLNGMNEDDLDLNEDFDPVGTASGLQNVVLVFDGPEEAQSWLNSNNLEFVKFATAWKVNLSTRFTLSAKEGMTAL